MDLPNTNTNLQPSRQQESAQFGNGAKLGLVNPSSLQILPNGNSDL